MHNWFWNLNSPLIFKWSWTKLNKLELLILKKAIVAASKHCQTLFSSLDCVPYKFEEFKSILSCDIKYDLCSWAWNRGLFI